MQARRVLARLMQILGVDQIRTDNPKARRRRLRLSIAAAIALVATAAYGVSRLSLGKLHVDREQLTIDTVRRGEFIHDVRASGVLQPRDVRWIVSQSAARVLRIVLRPGAVVAPDTVIAELTNPELENQTQEAELQLAQGEAQAAALRLTLASQVLDQKARVAEVRSNQRGAQLQADAEADAARTQAVSALQAQRSRLLADQLAERVAVEQERLATLRASTAAQLRAEMARLAQLRATLARQRALLAALTVRAGMQGVLQSMPVQVGQQLTVGTQIARVAAPGDLLAELRVPELEARDLAPGLSASVDLRNGSEVEGRVLRVDPGVENGAVRVEIEFLNPLPAAARPDLSVEGRIRIARLPDTLLVNRSANGQPESAISVFKLNSRGDRALRVAVTVGKASSREWIVMRGLQAGDRIITSDTTAWSARDELHID